MFDNHPSIVSICCITYNQENFIAQAIEGFLMQKTYFPFEIIIHDDASTDGTTDIIREYEKKYPDLIRAIYQTDNQYSKGKKIFPILFPEAKSKYIAMCEGDDYWTDPLKLKKQVDFLEVHPECVICFHSITIQYENNFEAPSIFPVEFQKEISTLDDLLVSNFIPTCSVMFKNGLVKEFPEWFYKVKSGDWALHVLNAQHGKIGYINNDMAVYRVHSKGVYSGLDKLLRTESVLQTREIVYMHMNPKGRNIIGEFIFRKSFLLASKYYYGKGDVIRSKMYLAKCFRYVQYNKKVSWKMFVKLFVAVWMPLINKVYQFAKRA